MDTLHNVRAATGITTLLLRFMQLSLAFSHLNSMQSNTI
jgi:hypothetical protein